MTMRLDCLIPQSTPNAGGASAPHRPLSGKSLPLVDLWRANPMSYVLTRILAPGSPEQGAPLWTAACAERTLFLDDVHCEVRRGIGSAAGKRCIVVFHGNSSCATGAMQQYSGLRTHGDVLSVNAPGYGATPPAKTHRQLEWQMAVNVQRVVDYVSRTYDPKDVVWLGFSLGSAQAAMGFAEMPGSHLLLEMPFTNVRALATKHVGAMTGARTGGWLAGMLVGCGMAGLPKHWKVPGSPFLTDGLDTESKLRRCAGTHRDAGSRVGIIYAEYDEVMDRHMPAALWAAYYGTGAPDPNMYHCLHGTGHNGALSDDEDEHVAAYDNHARATERAVRHLLHGAGAA